MKKKFLFVLIMSLAFGKSQLQEDDFSTLTLDAYLFKKRASITEGYITTSQKEELIRDMQRMPGIKKILEIGFNAGHSAELFLTTTNCEKLVSFDISTHPYVKIGAEFMKKKFGDRFTLIEGDSKIKVPEYVAAHSDEKFDLIFIDGDHSFRGAFSDIQNCSKLAHPETLVFLDDYVAGVEMAVIASTHAGFIELLDCKHTTENLQTPLGGDRTWAIAKYLLK